MMKTYLANRSDVLIVHAAGPRDYQSLKARFDEAGLNKYDNLRVLEYIYDMPLQMTAADVVICRAGAMTISEVAMIGRSAIIIPSPYVADNHQFINASALYEKSAALMIEEKNLNGKALFADVKKLLDDRSMRLSFEREVQKFALKDANKLIYDEICALVDKQG
jgi:UDP-N-acetylglucosamine--N-acetylmuramyl-(pentapeptide) pyrophosphoryl-undecaprenol N-acetylglucosamine transferase